MFVVLDGEDDGEGKDGGDGGVESDVLKPNSRQSFDLKASLKGGDEGNCNNNSPGTKSALDRPTEKVIAYNFV